MFKIAYLSIPASKSITISNKIPYKSINGEFMLVQNKSGIIYKSYIFFDITNIPANSLIHSAEIVLFKKINNNIKIDNLINIYPLIDDFSTQTTFNIQPQINKYYKKICEISPYTISVEIQITDIIRAWFDGSIINKGLVIEGNTNVTPLLNLGSANCKDKYLIPILKVLYDYPHIGYYPTYLPVPINYGDYKNPAEYSENCRLLITIVVTIKNKHYQVFKEYSHIPKEGTDIINVAYIPIKDIKPTIEIASSYYYI